MIDTTSLLQPISSSDPAGPNLEYDAAFADLERLAQGKAEQQVGSTIIPAEEPDWRVIVKLANELMARTKDLRVAMHLARGMLRTDGFPGFAAGLAVLHGLVEQFWPHVHPQLDPDDDNDPTMRMNIIAGLCDSATVIQWTRLAPLVSARGLGQYGLRDVEIATGDCPVPANWEGTPPNTASIAAAFQGADSAQLHTTYAAVQAARQYAVQIESLLTELVGVGDAANLSAIRTQLDRALKVLSRHVAIEAEALGAAQAGPADGSSDSPAAQAAKRVEGEIASRDDVVRAIDKISAYYVRNEPSSPVPLLLARTKRLVHKDFMAILRDLAPDGLSQIEMLRGREDEEDGSS